MSDKNNNLLLAEKFLLEPAELTYQHLEAILGKIVSPSIDLADLYFENLITEGISLEDHKVKNANFSINKGVGLRAVSGEKTGYAYSDDITFKSLEQAAQAAKSIVRQSQDKLVAIKNSSINQHNLYHPDNPLDSISWQQKIDLLNKIDDYAHKLDPRVIKVNASITGSYKTILVFTNEGLLVPDIRPLVRLNIQVIVKDKERTEIASFGGGGRFSYSDFLVNNNYLYYVEEAVRQAVLNLQAKSAPAGLMPVVLGPGWPGVLLHEAVGHGLEGDFNRKKTSVFHNQLNAKVASELCTVVDNGTLPRHRGSLNIDDEGVPTQNTVLIENGILKNYMQDRLNAKLMNMPVTGNGRRESYACVPMPRMTNTYMLPGKHSPEEIIASVDKGIYAVNFNGGQVDITSGQFVFEVSEGYLIDKGKISYPIKGVTLIGNGPEVLTKVTMVGNDLALDQGVGTCGKNGQSVLVCVGQPTIKVAEITVGGTKIS